MDRERHASGRPRRPSLVPPARGERIARVAADARAAAPRSAPLPPGLVLMGEFGRAHGLTGEVRLKSYTAEPKAIASYGPLTGQDGRAYTIRSVRQAAGAQADILVARVEGVATREAAEALNRLRLSVPRERLGEPQDDEFFLADLVGLSVEGPEGLSGRVVGVPDYGGGDLLEIALHDCRATLLLPFTHAFVPVVDLSGRRVTIDPPAGWLEQAGETGG